MAPDVVFDISRLATRFSRLTPNGIDRVDLAYARQFVTDTPEQQSILLTPLGPRLVPAPAARGFVVAMDQHWRESGSADADPVFQALAHRLTVGGSAGLPQKVPAPGWRYTLSSLRRMGSSTRWFGANALFPGGSPEKHVPARAVYLNVSQFPLWVPIYFKWLEKRPDVKAVFMIHDLLPLTYPEFFPKAEFARHRARLSVLARIAAAAIVTSEASKAALEEHLGSLGRGDLPILALPLPVGHAFEAPRAHDAGLAAHPYFVSCGTIEPRKNHLLLLQIWRELAAALGPATPKLVIVGARGWDNENVLDLIERSGVLAQHVIEVSSLSTPSLRRLLDNARGVLMPSFAEGFGLPVAEAVAVGVPVIASDIPAFRTFGGDLVTRLDTLDGIGWMAAIRRLAALMPIIQAPVINAVANSPDWSWYFGHVQCFLSDLQS